MYVCMYVNTYSLYMYIQGLSGKSPAIFDIMRMVCVISM